MAYTLGHSLAMQTYCVLSVVITFVVAVSVCMSQQTYDIYPEATCLNRTNNSTCLTLSNVLYDRDKYFTSQATLVFHDGDHILQGESVVSVSNISNFTLQGYGGNGSGLSSPTITCVNSPLSFSDTISLQITSINFNRCSIELTRATAVVQNSSFGNGSTTVNGGALAIFYSHVWFEGLSTSAGNIVGWDGDFTTRSGGALAIFHSRVWFSGFSTFAGNMAEYGGAIYTDHSNLMFSGNVIFREGSALHGGAVYCSRYNTLSFSGDSNFVSNTAGENGGAVRAYDGNNLTFSGDSNFTSNRAFHGGAVCAEDSNTLSFSGDSSFMSNTAGRDGGAVYTGESNTLNFSLGSSFLSNTAGVDGGAVFARDSNILNFSGKSYCSFNTAENGGAVYANDGNTLNFSGNSSFITNTAENGGAVYANDGNTLNFTEDSSFINNTAVDGGGVYASDSNTLCFSGNSSFLGNAAESDGGAVYATDKNILSFSGASSFMSNTARHNGTVYSSFRNTLSFSGDSTFMNNTADHGGTMYAKYTNTLSFSGTSSFLRNTADEGGAVFAFKFNFLNFSGNSGFVKNTAEYGGAVRAYDDNSLSFNGNSIFMNNTADFGGAVEVNYDNTLSFYGKNTFISNTAEYGAAVDAKGRNMLSFNGDSRFMKNVANFGGAVSALDSNRLHFSGDSRFMSNTAKYGGAVAAADSSITFNGNTIIERNEAEQGGGIFLSSKNVLNLVGCVLLLSNWAAFFGGGAFVQDGRIEFTGNITVSRNSAYNGLFINSSIAACQEDVHFQGNMAHESGGAIFSNRSIINFSRDATFMSNTARWGGAVAAVHSNTVSFGWNSSFVNNRAEYGGAVASADSSITFNGNTNIKGNEAEQGGGIFLSSKNVLNLVGCVLLSSNMAAFGGGAFVQDGSIEFTGNVTVSRNSAYNGLFINSNNVVCYGDVHFQGNMAHENGGAIFSNSSIISFSRDATFMSNTARWGGAVAAVRSNIVSFSGNSSFKFLSNTAEYGSAMAAADSSITFNGNTIIEGNEAEQGGGIFFSSKNVLNLIGCVLLSSNMAAFGGGGFVQDGSIECTGIISISRNLAYNDGGGLFVNSSNVACHGDGHFQGNMAHESGGAIFSNSSTVSFSRDTTFMSNTARWGGAVAAVRSNTVSFSGNSSFLSNKAEYGGAVAAADCLITFNGNTMIEGNEAKQGGGIFLSSKNVLNLVGIVLLFSNMAAFGGGGFVQDGSIEYIGSIAIAGNTASKHGGGLFINSSNIVFQGAGHFQDNAAIESGGAIFSGISNISLQGSFKITENTAELGGGSALYFSTLLLEPETELVIDNNQAHGHGGAIALQRTQFLFQIIKLTARKPCLLELLEESYNSNEKVHLEPITSTLNFHSNTAHQSGDTLYGGHLEIWVVCSEADSYSERENTTASNLHLSFDPYKQCESGQTNCNHTATNITLYPGQVLLVSLVAVGHRNGIVPTVVRAASENLEISSEFVLSQPMEDKDCTKVHLPLSSDIHQENLNLFPNDVCSSLGELFRFLIDFPSNCPVGFPHYEQGTCICDKRLQKYTQNCNFQTLTITRLQDDTFWVGVKGSEGLILHPYCPFDYCTTESTSFSLNSTDLQCTNGRSGILRGACQPGRSLAIGSSQCLSGCYNKFLALILAFAFAGVVLVAFLFLCHLTVAEGTLSGLIFYANILAVNQTVFFPSGERNLLTVFIAWLNLDLGIETCFFESLDTYYSTWLQFAFPFYVWVMVGAIIVVANRSVVFAKIIGSANPVAVLATLFLFSYTKLLRAIMTAFSFTTLEYPDGEKFVWLYDGNIGYLDRHDGRHIGLFLFSLIFLLFVFLPYTLLLLCGQFIQRKLGWLSSRKQLYLNSFLDAYYGPYKEKHRYWTGLLLILRFTTLFVATVINIRNPQDPFSNLLVILVVSVITNSLVVRGVYRKWYLDLLEASFSLNLIFLVGATYHVRQSGGNQAAVVNTSVGVVFVTFVGIVTSVVIQQVKEKVPDNLRTALCPRFTSEDEKQNNEEHSVPAAIPMTTVTYSVVGIGDTQTEQKSKPSTSTSSDGAQNQ